MTSIGNMVRLCEGLIGTTHVTEWEDEFLESVIHRTHGGMFTTRLTGKQVEHLERIFKKHFAHH